MPLKCPASPRKEMLQSRGQRTRERESLNRVRGEETNPERTCTCQGLRTPMSCDEGRQPDGRHGRGQGEKWSGGAAPPRTIPFFPYGNAGPVVPGFSRETGHPDFCVKCPNFSLLAAHSDHLMGRACLGGFRAVGTVLFVTLGWWVHEGLFVLILLASSML